MIKLRPFVLAIPLVLVGTLSGCMASGSTSGRPIGDPFAGPADDSAPSNRTDCITSGTWQLDMNDLANKMEDWLAEKGSLITSVRGDGVETLRFNPSGDVVFDLDIKMISVASMVDSELEMTITQNQYGTSTGNWAWGEGDNVTFTNWESGVHMETLFEIGGVESQAESDIPNTAPDGQDMTVISCSANAMQTKTVGSPFTSKWTKNG